MKDEVFLKEMGERIYTRRKSLKMTQECLADKMNVSVQMISNLELGKKAIRPDNLAKLCSALRISADYILTGHSASNMHDELCEKIRTLSDEKISLINNLVEICIKSEK